jgi:hypothetical protein
MQNRVSAQRFRQKRKNEFELLKESMDKLEAENKTLKNKVSQRNQKFKKKRIYQGMRPKDFKIELIKS